MRRGAIASWAGRWITSGSKNHRTMCMCDKQSTYGRAACYVWQIKYLLRASCACAANKGDKRAGKLESGGGERRLYGWVGVVHVVASGRNGKSPRVAGLGGGKFCFSPLFLVWQIETGLVPGRGVWKSRGIRGNTLVFGPGGLTRFPQSDGKVRIHEREPQAIGSE